MSWPAGHPASVVVPAHDEATVLGRCLDALASDPVGRQAEVVVVANGCSDATADVARAYSGRFTRLTVVDLPQAGKIAALNAGDDAVTSFPRVYLDADVELGPGAFSELVAALDTDSATVAAPAVDFDLGACSGLVRAFYRAYAELPYVRQGLVGLGVYGLSAAGRRRFDRFPDVIADDLFVQRCFTLPERITSSGTFTVRVPLTVRQLLKVRRRSVGGAHELAATMVDRPEVDSTPATRSTVRALLRLVVGRPSLLWPAIVYLVVGMLSRVRPVQDASGWTRDDSTRVELRGPTIVEIDGLPIWSTTQSDVIDHVMDCLALGQGGIIATPNVDILRAHARSTRTVLDKVDVLVPDGMPLLWAGRVQGEPLQERIAGSDLVWSLSSAAAETGRSVFLLGGAPGVADRAAAAFSLLRPGLRVVGTTAPPRGFEDSESEMQALREQLLDAKPDLVFVALGNPRQEQLAIALREDLPSSWFLGCGGSFDMAAGDQSRAPELWQRLGLEWLHRLRLEPGRLWRRYLVDDIPFAAGMMLRAAGRRLRRLGRGVSGRTT